MNHRPIDSRTIVVYPEVVDGNPLGATNVVRWFLNRPGRITGRVRFGTDELYFLYQRAFDDPDFNSEPDNLLAVRWYRRDLYHQWNFGDRSGTCYMLRKGRTRAAEDDTRNALVLDGRTHTEIASAFNQCKCFVSYDPYTMYSRYAALCGCTSIVVPMEGVPKEQWRPEKELRYGIAYGFGDIEWALETRTDLLRTIEQEEETQAQGVSAFVAKTQAFFGPTRSSSQTPGQGGS